MVVASKAWLYVWTTHLGSQPESTAAGRQPKPCDFKSSALTTTLPSHFCIAVQSDSYTFILWYRWLPLLWVCVVVADAVMKMTVRAVVLRSPTKTVLWVNAFLSLKSLCDGQHFACFWCDIPSALMLFVGWQKRHLPCRKTWVLVRWFVVCMSLLPLLPPSFLAEKLRLVWHSGTS